MEMFINKANATGRINFRDDLLTNFTKMKLLQNGKLTLAALLLFGNHGYSIHLGRFKAADTIIDDLLLKAPLTTALDEAMVFIKKHINLSYDFDGSLQRKEHWQYPLEALRELLLNAVVHRDYKNASDIVIKIFDDRIVFTSPGRLFGNLTIEDLQRDDYVSSIRNKLLAESFYLIGEIEKYGTGFVRIRHWLKDYPNVSFALDETGDHFRVVLTHVDDMAEQVADKHRTSTGQAPDRHAILEFCRQPRSAKEIMASSGMKHRETFMKNYLHPLIQEGLLSLTIPDKPRSPKQKYVATPAGISLSESKTIND